YLSLPDLSVTLRVADLPGWIIGDFLPEIWKSWASLPLFVILNVTDPFATDDLDSVKWNSVGLPAVTVMVVAFAAVVPVPAADAARGAASGGHGTAAARADRLV